MPGKKRIYTDAGRKIRERQHVKTYSDAHPKMIIGIRKRWYKSEKKKLSNKQWRQSERGRFLHNLNEHARCSLQRESFFGRWKLRYLEKICARWRVKMSMCVLLKKEAQKKSGARLAPDFST